MFFLVNVKTAKCQVLRSWQILTGNLRLVTNNKLTSTPSKRAKFYDTTQ